ncbi:MAG: flagellar motor protein MotB [Alphaproteobacteria bacterium]
MDGLEGTKNKQQNDPSVVLFVGLYLLLLAFFVLLNVISTLDEQRVKQVLDSVTATFRSDFGPLTSRPVYSSDSDAPLVSNRFLSDVEQLFENAMPVDQVDILIHGSLLEVVLKADTLFVPGEADILPEYAPLFEKLQKVTELGPSDDRYSIGIVMGSPPITQERLAKGETLEMARAGSIARRMRNQGTPASSIYTGIAHDDPKLLRLLFRVISGNAEGEVLFRDAGGR